MNLYLQANMLMQLFLVDYWLLEWLEQVMQLVTIRRLKNAFQITLRKTCAHYWLRLESMFNYAIMRWVASTVSFPHYV